MNAEPSKPSEKKVRRRWLQFGIRGLMLLTLVAAVGAWWWSQPEVLTELDETGAYRIVREVYRNKDDVPYNHGLWRMEDLQGRAMIEGEYRKDQRTGEWTSWHATGGIANRGEYANDKLAGTWQTWRADGTRLAETNYVDGVAEGPAKTFHDDGALESQGQLSAGQRTGTWEFFDTNRQMVERGQYERGLRVGYFQRWNADGVEAPPAYYVTGIEIKNPQRAVARWKDAMMSRHGMERARACEELMLFGELAYPALAEILQSNHAEAIELVLYKGPPRGSHALQGAVIRQLNSESQSVKDAAVVSLRRWEIELQTVAPRLTELFEEYASAVIGGDESPESLTRFHELVNATAEQPELTSRQVDLFKRAAVELKAMQRMAVLAAVASHNGNDVEAARAVVAAFHEADSADLPQRTISLYANDPIGWPPPLKASAIPAFVTVIHEGSDEEKKSAIATLTWMQAPTPEEAEPLVDELMSCLKTSDTELKTYALGALSRLGSSANSALPELRRKMEESPQFRGVAEDYIRALELNNAPMMPILADPWTTSGGLGGGLGGLGGTYLPMSFGSSPW